MPEGNKNKPNDPIQFRSEQVQVILTAPPGWMIKWGNGMILLLVTGFLWACWLIKYPDVISTRVILTTSITPTKIYANANLNLETILIKNNEKVEKGQPLAMYEKARHYKNLLKLKTLLDKNQFGDSILYASLSRFSTLELGDAGPSFHLFKRDALEFKSNCSNRQALVNLIESYSKLKSDLRAWEVSNLIRSPSDGKIIFSDGLNRREKIAKGTFLFWIIPENQPRLVGKTKLTLQNIYRIQKGQRVLISLTNYPSNNNGDLEGAIDEVLPFPDEKGFFDVRIQLPEKLINSKGQRIPFKLEMTGAAKIVLKDLRLIERFVFRMEDFNRIIH